ncbi:type IV pilus modification protein PilV [Marinobacter salinexigens]|nr:type IV pilus modification protein PilV [Marinobacter salinexigens]
MIIENARARFVTMRSVPQKTKGFTLIEVLVALLVLLIGLLGVAGLQLLSLQQANNANVRSQINLHTEQMVEMVRANGGSALASGDVDAWEAALLQDVPTASANIQFNGNVVNVTVTWDEREYGSSEEEKTYTYTARLEQ